MASLFRLFLCVVVACGASAYAQQWTSFAIPNGLSFVVGAGDSPVLLAVQFDPDKAVRSTDGGRTWTPVDVAGQRPIGFLAAPTDPNVFYAFVGSTRLAVDPPPRALYRSSDGGRTWQLATPRIQTPEGAVIENIAVGALPDLLYGSRMVPSLCFTGSCSFAGAEGYVSTDAGRTWRRSDPPTGKGRHTAFPSISDAQVAYATNYKGLFRTGDQGATWQLVLEAPAEAFIYERQVLVDRVDPSIVCGRFGVGPEMWASEDAGRTWRASIVSIPGGWQHLMADPLQAGRVYAVGAFGEIFESRDRARTWKRVAHSAGATATNVNNTKPMIAIEGGRRVVYAMTGEGPKRVVLFDAAIVLGSDLWWNPAQSGWGLSLTHHASGQIFGAWFTYDAQGDPTWRVMPGGAWSDARTFTATIYATRGPAYFPGPFDPSRVTVSPVGQATLVFDDDSNGLFRYRLDDGTAGESRITRQLFGPPDDAQVLDYADLWWNAAESGWGVAVAQQFGAVFAVWFVYDEAGRPTWIVMPNAAYGGRYVGSDFVYGFHGDLFTTKGPPSTGPFDPARVVAIPAGRATLRVDNIHFDGGVLIYDALGRTGTRALTRQPF